MIKKFTLLIIIFASGFLTHALFFPDLLSNGIIDVEKIALPNIIPSQTQRANQNDPLITKISFDGNQFSRTNVTIGFTQYIEISNTNRSLLMWLVSNDPSLTTPRGYGYTEMVRKQFNQKGQFIVANKNNPRERLVITVK